MLGRGPSEGIAPAGGGQGLLYSLQFMRAAVRAGRLCCAGLPRRLEGGRKIRRLADERPPDQIRISKNNEIKMWTPRVEAGAYHESEMRIRSQNTLISPSL